MPVGAEEAFQFATDHWQALRERGCGHKEKAERKVQGDRRTPLEPVPRSVGER